MNIKKLNEALNKILNEKDAELEKVECAVEITNNGKSVDTFYFAVPQNTDLNQLKARLFYDVRGEAKEIVRESIDRKYEEIASIASLVKDDIKFILRYLKEHGQGDMDDIKILEEAIDILDEYANG